MKKLLFFLVIFSSCAGPKGSFQRYYNTEVSKAKLAFSVPRWLPMMFIPKEDKEEVKFFTEGMKKLKILVYDKEDKNSRNNFKDFASTKNYESYLEINDGGNKVNVLSKETEGYFKEIILEFQSDEEHVLVAVLGDMNKKTFYEAIKKARDNKKPSNIEKPE